jgi:cardiolipin synthase
MIADRAAYAGSANLDARSLNINCELLVRIADPETAREARTIFENYLRHSRRILPEEWAKSRGLWQRLKENFAYWVLARLDPHFARREMRGK